ncbi:hypothetical protein RHGRI_011851 [Rhododendron griersonianum]|uniref:Uncharacterized protein n=1 Tax=Rhododendron griersonianum TaxID=479676 RepID=A0AAV6KPI9_9ERIC|nr:hypothetical protein RHGRI_011851 [Rhododendron griersonianum]KAG5554112.1 hypothetical protein RHGRI_011851 [Rhododendron griersonianum]KAG5554114.1 hypothetical protein RHGRI_011851 [Rhododendron griersonianum]
MMTPLLLRRSTFLKEEGDQLLVHRIPMVLQSKKRREKRFRTFGMAVSFEDALASTCPRFVEVLRVRRYKLGIERGAVYFLKTSNDTVFKEAAEQSEPFGPEVQPLPTTMESDATTEASKSDPMEDAIAASKNPKKHRALKNKKD